jgi:hypothetical protein
MLPTVNDTLALVVCLGWFQVATAVFVTTVPFASPAARVARNLSTKASPGGSGPLTAP